jgi:hypothetical protein
MALVNYLYFIIGHISFVWSGGIFIRIHVVFAADDGVLAPKHVADNN